MADDEKDFGPLLAGGGGCVHVASAEQKAEWRRLMLAHVKRAWLCWQAGDLKNTFGFLIHAHDAGPAPDRVKLELIGACLQDDADTGKRAALDLFAEFLGDFEGNP